jgi:hypothetical protein
MSLPAYVTCTGCKKLHVYPGRVTSKHYARTDVALFTACGAERKGPHSTRHKDEVGCEACLSNMVRNHEIPKTGGETRRYCNGSATGTG